MTSKEVDLVLSTLSFYEAMTVERIIFDFDLETVKKMKEFTREDLLEILKKLEKEKKIKKVKIKDSVGYIRLMPKKGLKRKIKNLLRLLKINL